MQLRQAPVAGECSGRLSALRSTSRCRLLARRAMSRRSCAQRGATAAAATVEFAKYQGLGNDFILVRTFGGAIVFLALLPGLGVFVLGAA